MNATLTLVDDHRAVLYGGYVVVDELCSDEVYTLDCSRMVCPICNYCYSS